MNVYGVKEVENQANEKHYQDVAAVVLRNLQNARDDNVKLIFRNL